MNKLQTITGRLGKNPVLYHRNTERGRSPVAKFSLAVVTFANGKAETVWFQCDAWDGRADVVMKNLHKGDSVQLHGFADRKSYKGVEYLYFNAVYVTPLGKARANITQSADCQPAPTQPVLPGLTATNPF